MTIRVDFPPDRVKAVRALLRLTQPEFAEKYGIAIQTVSRLESGITKNVTGPTLGALLRAAKDADA